MTTRAPGASAASSCTRRTGDRSSITFKPRLRAFSKTAGDGPWVRSQDRTDASSAGNAVNTMLRKVLATSLWTDFRV